MSRGKNFFPMARGEKVALGVLILSAAASFLPLARSVEVAGSYALALTGSLDVGLPPIVVSLSASALAMAAGGLFSAPETREISQEIAALHIDEPSGEA